MRTCSMEKAEGKAEDNTLLPDVIREPDKDHFVEKLCHHPNWLSEEMVLCMRDIFLSLADPSKLSSPECLASPFLFFFGIFLRLAHKELLDEESPR
jgi:hypothetical protein